LLSSPITGIVHLTAGRKCQSKVVLEANRNAFHDKTIVVTRCGRICLGNKKINFSQVFAGQAVGIKEVHDDIWLVSFMDYDLGYFDPETRVLEPLENPFGPKVLPM
jgi:putative transposase